MKIITYPVGSYETNCYLVTAQKDRCVLIDPGNEAEMLLQRLQQQALKLEAILLTHGHFDHVGAVRQLAAETGCRVYICPKEAGLPETFTAGPLFYTHTYGEGDRITEAGLTFRVLHTPGHTPGSVCLLCGDTLFSGDTLFAGSIGRTDFPGGSFPQIKASLYRLSKLEGDLQVLPGHAEPTTLEQERQTNPFMK